jgi:hypothetical protein
MDRTDPQQGLPSYTSTFTAQTDILSTLLSEGDFKAASPALIGPRQWLFHTSLLFQIVILPIAIILDL